MSETFKIRYRDRDFTLARGDVFDPDLADQLIDQPSFELAEVVRKLLRGIEAIKKGGCLDHLDCFEERGPLWDEPLEFAKEALVRYDEFSKGAMTPYKGRIR